MIACFDNSSVKMAAGTVLVSQGNWDYILKKERMILGCSYKYEVAKKCPEGTHIAPAP